MHYFNMNFYRSNSLFDLLLSLAFFVISLLILIPIKRVLLSRLRKYTQTTPKKIDNELVIIADKYLMPIIVIGVFYFSCARLDLSEGVYRWTERFSLLFITLIVTQTFVRILVFSIMARLAKKSEGTKYQIKFSGFIALLKASIWFLAILFILDNLGFKISTVIAGLGIGGVAIALAAQAVLGDLFNYFVIIFDEPFKVGDFIIFDEYMGTVELVGLKTTRIKSLTGEQIVVSNTALVTNKIRNYQKLEERRIVFNIGVIYETSHEIIVLIPSFIKQIISECAKTRFDRCNFANFGDFSLNFETVYFVLSSDYNEYMKIHESILLGIHKQFSSKGIVFAFPTKIVHLVMESPQSEKLENV